MRGATHTDENRDRAWRFVTGGIPVCRIPGTSPHSPEVSPELLLKHVALQRRRDLQEYVYCVALITYLGSADCCTRHGGALPNSSGARQLRLAAR